MPVTAFTPTFSDADFNTKILPQKKQPERFLFQKRTLLFQVVAE